VSVRTSETILLRFQNRTVMPQSSDTFSTFTPILGGNEFFFLIVLKLLNYVGHLVLVVQIIKNDDLRPQVYFFIKKPHCPNLRSMLQSSDSACMLLSLYRVWYIDLSSDTDNPNSGLYFKSEILNEYNY